MTHVDVVFLGTIHCAHLIHKEYSFGHIAGAYKAAQPDLLLVEIRPEFFQRGDMADGPIEMSYLVQLARRESIDIAGIDWFQDNQDYFNLQPNDKELQDLETELKQCTSPSGYNWPLNYTQCHQWQHLRYLQKLHHTRIRYLGDTGHGDWLRRNLWMAHYIIQAIKRLESKQVLLAVGVEHIADLWDLLSIEDAISCHLSGQCEELMPLDYAADEELLSAWKSGIEHLDKKRSKADSSILRQKLESKIECWKQAVEQRGIVR